jgi:hypothetical protein
MRDAGNGDLMHGWMRGDHFLDLARPHLEAACLDHVLLAIDQENVALLVHVGEIAGVHPGAAVAVCLQHEGSLAGVVPVLRKMLRRPQQHLADLIRATDLRCILGVDDTHFHVGKRNAD